MTAAAPREAAGRPVDVPGLEAALAAAVTGEVRFDAQAKSLYATDASHYRRIPIGVVLPRTTEDVEKTVAVCRDFDAPITSRGGGTSLAGQCCNTAVVIDFSKYLNRIFEIDLEDRSAWVEPGCVLDDLRNAAEAHGLTFGPDPSTHNHNTLGGMLGNNSCGVHALLAGRTADNVIALDVLTFDGLRLTVGATDDETLRGLTAEDGRRGEIYRGLVDLRDHNADLIRARFPDIPRRVSGYCLEQLLPENSFDVARALVGSEGTCVTILRAKLRLIESPPARTLVVLGFASVYEAADAVPAVLKHAPVGLEGIDDKLILFMREKGMQPEPSRLLPEGDGWLLVEFGGDNDREAQQKARALIEDLGLDDARAKLVDDPFEAGKIWEVRKSGLGATAHVPSMPETHPGWEDAAVPPERLGAYLRDFRRLLDDYGYDCSLYGHFGDGCVHCRIDFDFKTLDGVNRYLAFIQDAAKLVVDYGGSLSGEHGDGQSRAILLEKMYGPELTEAFRQFKTLWDPHCRMNPGKVVDPRGPADDLRLGTGFRPWVPTARFAYPEDGGNFIKVASRCVGVGECRKHDSGVMCPSYRATGEEAHSTRGRAHMLFEMMRSDVIEDRWRSEAVRDSLDLCLACKACKSECPVNVDMATYKAEFMHHHYRRRLRPRDHYAMGLIWWWARAAAQWPGPINAAFRNPGLARLLRRATGIAAERELPAVAAPSFRRWFLEAELPRADHRGASSTGARESVVLWPDTFNSYFTPGPLQAASRLLSAAGYEVVIPERPLCCGRPLYAPGMLSLARRLWQRNLAVLQPHIRRGTPIVVVEPACASAFRDELPNLLPYDEDARRLSQQVRLLSEFLRARGYQPPQIEGAAVVHGHCHHHSILRMDDELALLDKTGLRVQMLDGGCCGMAGDFGFRRETYEVAMKVGEQGFLPALRETPRDTFFIANGYSCREQARQATGRTPLTLAELLYEGARREEGGNQ